MDFSELRISPAEDASLLPIQVQPGASRDAVAGVIDGAVKVRVSARPVEGAANERCLKFLAKKVLSCPRSRLSMVSGDHSRRKVICIEGLTPEEVLSRLEAFCESKS